MSEVSEKISRILEDPESMKIIAEIASSFISSEENEANKGESNSAQDEISLQSPEDTLSNFSSIISSLGSVFSADEIDNTILLIKALQPYLSDRRKNNSSSVIKFLSALKSVSGINLTGLTSILTALR